MKRKIVFCVSSFLLFLFTLGMDANANDVTTINATGTTTSVAISGTTEADTAAVMIQVLSGADTIIAMESFAVNGTQFSGTIDFLTLTEGNTYTVQAADYEGGTWQVATFTVPVTPAPTPTPTTEQQTNSSTGSTGTTSTITTVPTGTTPATTDPSATAVTTPKKSEKDTTSPTDIDDIEDTGDITGDKPPIEEDTLPIDNKKDDDTTDQTSTEKVDTMTEGIDDSVDNQNDAQDTSSQSEESKDNNTLTIILIVFGIAVGIVVVVFTVIKIKAAKKEEM